MKWHKNSSHDLILSSPVVPTCSATRITILSANIISNKLAVKVPNEISINLPFCSFVAILIISQKKFSKIRNSSRDFTIFIIYSISSIKITHAVVSSSETFLWIPALIDEVTAINPNGKR